MEDFKPSPFGKYLLLDKIGVGGTAEIYKAKTFSAKGFEKYVAIKKVLPQFSANDKFIDMLVNEAKMIVQLFHPNIVEVYDLDKEQGSYYFAMEFIEGFDLKVLIDRSIAKQRKLPFEIVAYILSEICYGLEYAHSKKDKNNEPLQLIHRDMSPHNILISYSGEIKITDFGIAKAASSANLTQVGALKGKITYLAPEQVKGKKMDHRADIFSTGLVLYECLMGEKFFHGDSVGEILGKIASTKVTENTFSLDIPLELRKCLAKALAFEVEDRYQNAGDMAEELSKYLHSNFTDFNKRKFVGFIQELFQDDIVKLTAKKAKEAEITATYDNVNNLMDKTYVGLPTENQPDKTKNKNSSMLLGLILFFGVGFILFLVLVVGGFFAYRYYESKQPLVQVQPTATVQPSGQVNTLSNHSTETQQTNQQLQAVTPGKLSLSTVPPGAQIYLNNEKMNRITPTALDLDVGKSYVVILKKEGYEDWAGTLQLNFAAESKEVFLKKLAASKTNTSNTTSTPVKKTKKRKSNGGGGGGSGGGDWGGGRVW